MYTNLSYIIYIHLIMFIYNIHINIYIYIYLHNQFRLLKHNFFPISPNPTHPTVIVIRPKHLHLRQLNSCYLRRLVGCCEPAGKNEKKTTNPKRTNVLMANRNPAKKLTSVEVGSCGNPHDLQLFFFGKMIHPNGG